MSKAILIMDMPKNCADCVLCGSQEDEYFCIPDDFAHYLGDQYVKHGCDKRPDWCPLCEVPRKKTSSQLTQNELEERYEQGYNDCIDDILGQ